MDRRDILILTTPGELHDLLQLISNKKKKKREGTRNE